MEYVLFLECCLEVVMALSDRRPITQKSSSDLLERTLNVNYKMYNDNKINKHTN